MSSQFGQQTGTQAPKGMGVIDLDVELFSQLTIDGLDNLANRVKSAADGFGGWSAWLRLGKVLSLRRLSLSSWRATSALM